MFIFLYVINQNKKGINGVKFGLYYLQNYGYNDKYKYKLNN